MHVAVDDEYASAEASAEASTGASAETTTSEAPRYPKRNIEQKNYHEESDEETDPENFCFCE